jgi:hypothetical protein
VSEQDFYSTFSDYLRSGNASKLHVFCINPEHSNRLAVYRNGFYKSAIDALMANYPMCVLLVGEPLFRQIARAYVEQSPPQQATLVGYGEHFAMFIAKAMSAHVTDDSLAAVAADVAEVDRNWLHSLSSAEPSQVLTAALVQDLAGQGVDITTLQVSLTPPVRLCGVASTALQRWLALKVGSDLVDVHVDIDCTDADVTAMFWRLQGVVQIRVLSAAEIALMRCLQQPTSSLAEAFNAALAVDERFDVSDFFSTCLQNQLIDVSQY